jgi:TFIIF-interacting CTD phosphatase-like protein
MNKKLLVLDIDSTLIFAKPQEKQYIVAKRPYLDEFMEYIFSAYDVALWTAGSSSYAKIIAEHVFPQYKERFKFIWSVDECETGNIFGGLKPLRKLWSSDLAKQNGWDEKNTLMVEDTPENCMFNEGNCLIVPKFTGEKGDETLRYLKIFLSRIASIKVSGFSGTLWLKYEKAQEKITKPQSQLGEKRYKTGGEFIKKSRELKEWKLLVWCVSIATFFLLPFFIFKKK